MDQQLQSRRFVTRLWIRSCIFCRLLSRLSRSRPLPFYSLRTLFYYIITLSDCFRDSYYKLRFLIYLCWTTKVFLLSCSARGVLARVASASVEQNPLGVYFYLIRTFVNAPTLQAEAGLCTAIFSSVFSFQGQASFINCWQESYLPYALASLPLIYDVHVVLGVCSESVCRDIEIEFARLRACQMCALLLSQKSFLQAQIRCGSRDIQQQMKQKINDGLRLATIPLE